MRWFVVFLLLANLALYLWVAYGESPRPALDVPPPDIGRLPLLHEVEAAVKGEPVAPGDTAIPVPPDEVPIPAPGTGTGGAETGVITVIQEDSEDEVPLSLDRAATAGADEAVPAVDEVFEPADPPGLPAAALRQSLFTFFGDPPT